VRSLPLQPKPVAQPQPQPITFRFGVRFAIGQWERFCQRQRVRQRFPVGQPVSGIGMVLCAGMVGVDVRRGVVMRLVFDVR
jgi:hypothetical protein